MTREDIVNIAPGEYQPEDLRALIRKDPEGQWIGIAFIEQPERRIIVSITRGANPKKVARVLIVKAIDTLIKGSEEPE